MIYFIFGFVPFYSNENFLISIFIILQILDQYLIFSPPYTNTIFFWEEGTPLLPMI